MVRGTLCDRPTSVFAVTGNPVPFYLLLAFFGKFIRRLQRCFPADASTLHILLYQVSPRILLLNGWDYTRCLYSSQANAILVSNYSTGIFQMLTPLNYLLVALAALAAGTVNALAGGGTLITFPMLIFLGIPAVSANVTNTVALCPGYFGGTMAQRNDLRGQGNRMWLLVPAGIAGGVLGGFLLIQTGEKIFKELVPYLILLASLLLAVQDPVRAWLTRRMAAGQSEGLEKVTWIPAGLASIYGGYFGAGLGVMLLSALGLTLNDNLTRLNALKQTISFSVNVSAAIFFLFSGKVVWSAALVMAVGALIGGALGGRLAGRIKPSTLRWTVVTIGIVVSFVYFVRG
jgi:uncharacterized membrane protein YfcA